MQSKNFILKILPYKQGSNIQHLSKAWQNTRLLQKGSYKFKLEASANGSLILLDLKQVCSSIFPLITPAWFSHVQDMPKA